MAKAEIGKTMPPIKVDAPAIESLARNRSVLALCLGDLRLLKINMIRSKIKPTAHCW
jgi:hypothetical protein